MTTNQRRFLDLSFNIKINYSTDKATYMYIYLHCLVGRTGTHRDTQRHGVKLIPAIVLRNKAIFN